MPASSVSVLKGVSPCVLCANVDVASLPRVEKILSEYSNNRHSLMSKTVLLKRGQFGQDLAHLRISIVSIISCEYLGEKGDLPASFMRVLKGVSPCLLCASLSRAEKTVSE